MEYKFSAFKWFFYDKTLNHPQLKLTVKNHEFMNVHKFLSG